MVVTVLSTIRHLLARTSLYSSVVGDSMLVRLRSTTIGLLGVVTAVGLALVAFIAQLGVPGVFDGAIPDRPGGHGPVADAIVLTPGPVTTDPSHPGVRVGTRPSSPVAKGVVASRGLGDANQVGNGPAAGPPPASPQAPPQPTATPEPTGRPAPESPTSVPTPDTADPPRSTSSEQPRTSSSTSSSNGRGHSGRETKTRARGKPKSSTHGSSGHRGGRSGSHSGKPPKETSASTTKPGDSATAKPLGGPSTPEPDDTRPPEGEPKEGRGHGKSDKARR